VHTIILTTGLLREIPHDDAQRDQRLGVIDRTAKGMDHLIRDLLDVTRIESGTFAVHQARVHVRALLDETLELFEAPARERRVRLRCHVDDDVAPVLGDRDRLEQVLSNLIGNALKFTPPEGEVRLSAERTPRARDAIEITIVDTGSGIPADQVAHVFDRFWQADRRGRAGAGLGLSIAKGIVEAHGGEIRVESRVGEGTTFRVELPLGVREPARA
jgi:signal transduction histidine kinase